MLFEISLLILSINAGINCPLLLTLHVVRWGGLVLMFIEEVCSLMLLEISLSTLPMGVELTYPILLTLYVVRRVKLCPNNSKKV